MQGKKQQRQDNNNNNSGSTAADRIGATFRRLEQRGERALICYVVAGYPDAEATAGIVDALVAGGADIIELGIPFSDPIADGPTIQKASQAALDAGVTPEKALQIAKIVRKRHPDLPLLVMTYSNILVHAGWDGFLSKCRAAGIDGFILPDMPVEEAGEYTAKAAEHGMATVFLASPNTSPERLKEIASHSSGFMYLVSVYGITGARSSFEDYTKDAIKRAKEAAGHKIPVGVGFGISRPEHARFMAGAGADAIIVGSAIIDRIARAGGGGRRQQTAMMLADLKSFAASLKKALK
ncbi:tryptophan synthase subunit alpha [Nitrososphaera sp.]|uniref:tryptophan synthase subunit alpha n=1 Tax=Nitrososphaera sp. TaxID=1971748 RepID=UPI00307DA09A